MVAAWRIRRAGTSGAASRIAASSANRLRSGTLARLSVPTATRTPEVKKRPIGGGPTPTQRLLRGQVTSVAPVPAIRASSRSVSCTPWTASVPAAITPRSQR